LYLFGGWCKTEEGDGNTILFLVLICLGQLNDFWKFDGEKWILLLVKIIYIRKEFTMVSKIILVQEMMLIHGLIHSIICICLVELVIVNRVTVNHELLFNIVGNLNDLWRFDGKNWIW